MWIKKFRVKQFLEKKNSHELFVTRICRCGVSSGGGDGKASEEEAAPRWSVRAGAVAGALCE